MDELNTDLVWIAVQGLSQEEALSSLEMELAESPEARNVAGWPDLMNRRDYLDRTFVAQLPDGWLLLFGDLYEEKKDRLLQLVRFGPAFAGEMSRGSCFANGASYEGGQQIWRMDYDFEGREPDKMMIIEGLLPPKMAAIIDQAYAAEAAGRGSNIGVDVLLNVPSHLSKAICGFSPLEQPPAGFRWSLLQRLGGEPEPEEEPRSWFARLFGL